LPPYECEATNISGKTKMKFMPGNSCLEIQAWKFMPGNTCLEIDAWKYEREGRRGITRLALQVIGIAGVFTASVVN
jgi:hypothetical protein